MLKATILDYQSLAPDDLDLEHLWQLMLEWHLYDHTSAEQTAERISGMDIILTNKVILDAELLKANPQIKLIIILATGTNNVDLQAARTLGIPVCNIVAYSTESVVQQTFACLLALQSRLREYDDAVKRGDWCNSPFFGLLDYQIQEVAGKTLGIIGFGAIGRRVKQVAEAFGMRVLVAKSLLPEAASQPQRVTLEQIYTQADVISIHCPLSDYSRDLINTDSFAQMKETVVLLNMGRGGIVNEAALAEALKSGRIKAAATDVLTEEPPSPDHLLLDSRIPNLIITPHTAWASQQARQALLDQVVNILQSLDNGPLVNQVV